MGTFTTYPILSFAKREREENIEAVLRFQAMLDEPVLPTRTAACCPACPSILPMVGATVSLNQCVSCLHVEPRKAAS